MNDTKISSIDRIISSSLYLTGLFAAIGALYSWGNGVLWTLPPDAHTPVYLADLVLAAPVSLAAAHGLHKRKPWAQTASVLAAGIFLYGSFLVYAGMAVAPETFSWRLFLPPVFGVGLSAVILRRAIGRTANSVDIMQIHKSVTARPAVTSSPAFWGLAQDAPQSTSDRGDGFVAKRRSAQ